MLLVKDVGSGLFNVVSNSTGIDVFAAEGASICVQQVGFEQQKPFSASPIF
jgi:hypothetical protein